MAIINSMNERMIIGIDVTRIILGRKVSKDEHSKIMVCPAIMFAVSRKIRVRGRMKNLDNSIKNISGIKGIGVPWGVR